MDLSKLSDEELDAILAGKDLPDYAQTTPGAAQSVSRQKMLSPAPEPEDFTRGMSSGELALAGAGGNLYGLGVGAARAGVGLADMVPGVDLSDTKKSLDLEAQEVGRTMRDLRRTTPGMLGDLGSNMVVSAAVPASRGTGMLSGARNTAAASAPVGFLSAYGEGQPVGNALMVGAATGVGGAVASAGMDAATKAVNALRGEWGDPMKKYVRDFARERGVELRTGDMYPNSVVRRLENVSDRLGNPKLPEQTEQLEGALFGKRNEILAGIERARKVVDEENVKLWSPVYEAAEAAGTTSVRPVGLYNAMGELLNKYPQAMAKIENQEVRRLLENIASSGGGKNLPPLTFREARELSQAIGPELAAMKIQAANGSMTRGQVEAVSKLYGSIKADLKRWGNAGQNQKAYKLYENANNEFKESLLPFYSNDIVVKAQKGAYDGHAESMLQDLLRPLGKNQREHLMWYLGKTDHDAAGYMELLQAANRAGTALKSDITDRGELALGATLFAPKAMATAAVGGSGSSKLLPLYAASRESISPVVDRAVKGGLGLTYGDMFGNKGR